MPSQHRIDVRLFVDGRSLLEHPAPGGILDTNQLLTRYVEVKAGQRFTVRARVEAGFKLHGADTIECDLSFDQSDIRHLKFAEQHEFQHHNGMLLADVNLHHETICIKNDYTGEHEKSELLFGVFGTNEKAQMEGLSADVVSKLGCIQVDVFRARTVPRKHPRISNVFRPKVHHEAPEHMLKGRSLKNIVEYGPGIPVQVSSAIWYDTIPITGAGSMKFSFRFLYRTHEILKHLGIIPRSPSPTPDAAVMLARTEAMLAEAKNENREIKRELESMRNSAKVSATPDIKPPIGVKRERAAIEDDGDLIETAPPAQKPRIEIDLTGDD